jgi:crotonobetainyl-CoA:carnitine CoA-transferase CaiB-like acyl-CoA transferase
MPDRISSWAVYDVFSVKDGGQIFLAAVSDTRWALMCDEFGFADLKQDPRLTRNNARVQAREWMLPLLRERFAAFGAAELAQRFEKAGLPYAPITRPQDLFDDPHPAAEPGRAHAGAVASAGLWRRLDRAAAPGPRGRHAAAGRRPAGRRLNAGARQAALASRSTRPATMRTLRGAASQMATIDMALSTVEIQNASA